MKKLHYKGPVVLAVLDGVGISLRRSGNAVRQAHTEFLDRAIANYLNIPLRASGEAVGLIPGQMGNSEVGHNALGSGQIIPQGVAHIEADFGSGLVWDSKAWRGAMKYLKTESNHSPEHIPTLHFCGIMSDGGVHSDMKYLEQMIARAYQEGIRRIRIHALFDGRDTPPQSEPKYINRIERFCAQFKDADFRIASGAGRMVAVADRYGNDWGMVERGWKMMVDGIAPREFKSATEAIKALRRENPSVQDQYLPEFVIVENVAAASALSSRASRARHSSAGAGNSSQPVGRIEDGDAVIYYDFRADRAVEISTAFTDDHFDKFPRPRRPKIYYAGLTEYDLDQHIPKNVLVPTIDIQEPLNVFLAKHQISQFAISETVKFGHITYYFNGNSYKKAPLETHQEIKSDLELANSRPWMKSAEITDAVLPQLDQYDFVRINFPNGDIVGHFAELEPAIIAVEAVDLQLARIAKKVDELGGLLIITADHGNAEELLDESGQPKTAHTTNPVPCIFYDNTINSHKYHSAKLKDAGLTNLASTISLLLGLPDYPGFWRPPLIALD